MRSIRNIPRKRTYKLRELSLHENCEHINLHGPYFKGEEFLICDALLIIVSAFVVITQNLIGLGAVGEEFQGIRVLIWVELSRLLQISLFDFLSV